MKLGKTAVALFLLLPLLSSCEDLFETSSVPVCSVDDDSSTTSSDTTPDSSSEPLTAFDLSTIENGGFIGNYHSKLGAVTFEKDKVVIDEAQYTPVLVSGSGLESIINLVATDGTTKSLTFSNVTGSDSVVRVRPVITVDETATALLPSLKSIVGGYDFVEMDAYYKNDYYSVGYDISDIYNQAEDCIYMGYYYYSTHSTSTYNAVSYFTYINDALTLGFDMMDYNDDTPYDSFYASTNSAGYLTLPSISYPDYSSMYPSLRFAVGSLFDGTSSNYCYVEEGTYYLGSDASYTFSYVADSNGQKIKLSDDSYLQSNGFSVVRTDKEGKTTEYVYDDLSAVEGTYETSGLSFSFDSIWETLTINGTSAAFSYVIKDHFKAVQTTVNDVVYTIVPEISGQVAKVYAGNEEMYLLNTNYFASSYVNDFIYHNGTATEKLYIDSSYNVTYKSSTVDGALVYDTSTGDTFLSFAINAVTYKFQIFESTSGLYTLTSETYGMQFFFPLATIEDLYGDWTNKVTTSLTFDNDYITVGDDKAIYTVGVRYDEASFTYDLALYFTINNVDYWLDPSNGMFTLYNYDAEASEYALYNYYIKTSEAQSLIGRYCFVGSYGEEAFELTEDGTFYADTPVDGKLVKTEYEYFLGKVSDQLCIAFITGNYAVYLYKSGAHLTTFGNNYVLDYIFDYNGFYADTTSGRAFYLEEDNVYLDGTSYTLSSYKEENDQTILTFGDYTATLSTKDGVKSVVITDKDGETYLSVNETEVDLDSYVGSYTVSGSTYSFSKVTDSISGAVNYYLVDSYNNQYSYTLYVRNGYITFKFSAGGSTYYLYNNGTENVLEAESSIPLPPPLSI